MKNFDYYIFIVLFFISFTALAQPALIFNEDKQLKDSLYNVNRRVVVNYTMKEFDTLFFEFFEKKANPAIVLSKIEFYSYTIKIAAFSDRLTRLYPAQKETAAESKKKWMSESYQDYLLYKASQKK